MAIYYRETLPIPRVEPQPLPRTLRAYVDRLAGAETPLSFDRIVAATPGVNLFGRLKERGLIRNVVPKYDELPTPIVPRVSHYVLTDAGRACLGDRSGFRGWRSLEQRGVLAVWCASFVLDQPARPAGQRDMRHVRGLAARVLYDLGNLSWSDVALGVYRRRVHNTAHTAAQRWTGTPEAALAGEILRRTLDPIPDTPTPTPPTHTEPPHGL